MPKKKSYTPWKMWGAWVGLVWGLLSILISLAGGFACHYGLLECFSTMTMIIFFPAYLGALIYESGAILISPVLGFIIGWAIHSLFRKFKWSYK